MSTETTNKKIKIDNGTTFGRAYTDKAVDELLKNVSGGDIWLDITPYLNEDETSISQEGYDLVWNAFSNATENPNNKYAGILYNNYKAYLNKTIMGDKAGIVFNVIAMLDTETIEFVITIYNDKSVVVSQKFDSSSPVWYDLSDSSVTAIGQEQYDEIKALADSNMLAGIIVAGGIYPLTFRHEGTFLFSTTCVVGQTLERTIQQNECTIKSDLSITTKLKEYPYIERLIGLSRQVIPSIKTNGLQENLAIGDGLAIENGALKTNNSSVFDITPYLINSTSISVEGYNAVREFVTSNKGGIVKFDMGEHVMYTTCSAASSDSLTFNYYFVFDSGAYDTTFTAMTVNSKGNVTSNNLTLYQVLANPVDDPTDTLTKIKINGIVYSIPVGKDYSTEISTLNSRVDSLANEVSQYSGSISNLESRVSSLETASTSYAQAGDVDMLNSRVSDIENTIGDINSILDNINGEVI